MLMESLVASKNAFVADLDQSYGADNLSDAPLVKEEYSRTIWKSIGSISLKRFVSLLKIDYRLMSFVVGAFPVLL